MALWQEIAERLPDYVFARVTLARLYLINKETDAAETLLKPLLKSRFTRQDILAQ
ncbi:hypothetical protein [Pleurocapsa sp. PCC 7327]|uniref:hypothetical protein n=1 Tax=Pleurocapsa sp. PCC 7327 TaxID=118163 RepID=UPI0002E92C87|nr:hypothetical protein [Pleurocapsa sp. PCC 7327]